MISENEALERILARVPGSGLVEKSLAEALGDYAAKDLFASVSMPGFDNSAMDGYAVRAADCRAGAKLHLAGTQAAGRDQGLSLSGGEAIRIFTGAPIPRGADAVVMQEDTSRASEDAAEVTIETGVEPGEFIRRRGADLCEGQKIIDAGEKLHSARLGLLASQGMGTVSVGQKPRVCVLSTGDELAEPGTTLRAGELYNSNGPMLSALVRECGIDVVSCRHLKDDPEAMREATAEEVAKGGVLVISGGVSVGERDFVKQVLESNHVETGFWRVRVKPGKPLLFGQARDQGTLVFGLPGNPVSSFVTFCLFVRPALMKWQGAGEKYWAMPERSCRCVQEIENAGLRPHYVRGSLRWQQQAADQGNNSGEVSDSELTFTPASLQESHGLRSLSESDALLRVGEGATVLENARVRVHCPFDS